MLSQVRPTSISVSKQGDVAVVSIAGPLSASGGDLLLRAEVAEAIYDGERKIVLDFTALSTLDSSGLGELVRAATAVQNCGGRMAWAACPKSMLDLLEIVDMKFESVDFVDSAREAIEALGG